MVQRKQIPHSIRIFYFAILIRKFKKNNKLFKKKMNIT